LNHNPYKGSVLRTADDKRCLAGRDRHRLDTADGKPLAGPFQTTLNRRFKKLEYYVVRTIGLLTRHVGFRDPVQAPFYVLSILVFASIPTHADSSCP
jgi:hypothetical protein